MSLSFWRVESETVHGVKYLPRDEKATDLCKLLGKSTIQGESSMDKIFEFCDKIGVTIEFCEIIL